MNVFSAASLMACIAYFFIGIFAFFREPKAILSRLFLMFCFSMSIWSFAYAFVYVSVENQHIWMKISAIGWCTFSSFILHMTLQFTENKIIRNWLTKVLLYVPSLLFFYISVFLFRKDSQPSKWISNFFYIGDFIYNFSFLLLSIVLIVLWGKRSSSGRKRKQAVILVATSLTPFLLNLVMGVVLPVLGLELLPALGHVYSLIMVVGVYYAMIKYRLFEIAPKLLVEELLQEMMDLVILISPEGRILRINKYTEQLLGYTTRDLTCQPLSRILPQELVDKILDTNCNNEINRLSDVFCIRNDGSLIPVGLTSSPIIDPGMKDLLGIIIVGQDIRLYKDLEREAAENRRAREQIMFLAHHDSLTGLPNRKYFYEHLSYTLLKSDPGRDRFAVLFLDMDDLKQINDCYGHEAGDMALCEIGRRARACIGETDILARIGGDEFTFLVYGVTDHESAMELVERILNSVNQSLTIQGSSVDLNVSIGLSLYPEDGSDPDVLVKKADNKMYAIKREKKKKDNHYVQMLLIEQ